MLTESGGTEEPAKAMLRKFGRKHDTLALNLAGFIISIPVFFGSAYIVLAPLPASMAKITRKKLPVYVIALYTGLCITHSMVPPTPGPVAVFGILNVNIGFVILYGCILGIIASLLCGWLLSTPLGNRIGYTAEELMEGSPAEEIMDEEAVLVRDPNAPSAGLVVALILFPTVLIGAGAIAMGYSPVVLTMIICAGSMGLSIPTDGGFWIVSRMSKLDTKQTLMALSIPSTLSCVVLFALSMVLNTLTGILPGL